MSEGKGNNGKTWKNERYLSSYEEADLLRKSLLMRFDGELEVKVKRCGEAGKLFVVKSRNIIKE